MTRFLACALLAAASVAKDAPESLEVISAARRGPRDLFIVITTQRTGSTWFVEELDTHPCLEVTRELFLDVKFYKSEPEFHWIKHEGSQRYALDALLRPTGSAAPVRANLTHTFDDFYKHCVRPAWDRGPKGRRDRMPEGCGFKWMLSQHVATHWDAWFAQLCKDRGIRLVFLTRRNVLRLYMSSVAKKRQDKARRDAYAAHEAWAGAMGQNGSQIASHNRLTLATGDALLGQLHKIEAYYETITRIEQEASERGIPWHRVTYEDLQADKARALSDVVDFVLPSSACPHTFAEAHVERLHPLPMATYVANWEAVAATLEGTRYARFVEGEDDTNLPAAPRPSSPPSNRTTT